jgi:dihydroorotase
MSRNGANFYRLPINSESITLQRESWTVPDSLAYADSNLIPFMAGETLHWKLVSDG